MVALASRRLPAVLAALVLVAVAAPVSAGPLGVVPSDHDRIVAYWTAERIRSAIPRDYVLDPSSGRIVPQKPGGGGGGGGKPGGGGGGGSSAVTGASWTGGGLVKATTGKVLFSMAGGNYVCSGSVVTDSSAATSLVLTAGHCVYDETNRAFATNWMFFPDFDSSPSFDCATATYGCWAATALVTTGGWASSGDFNHDIGFAVIGPGGRSGSAQLDATVGAQAIGFNRSHPADVYAFGYPHASPYDGTDLVYCAGRDFDDTLQAGSLTWGLKCNMTGGSSGGPWFVGFDATAGTGTLNSVNSYKYLFDKNTMYGPYFGAWEQKAYGAALGATANTIVNAP